MAEQKMGETAIIVQTTDAVFTVAPNTGTFIANSTTLTDAACAAAATLTAYYYFDRMP